MYNLSCLNLTSYRGKGKWYVFLHITSPSLAVYGATAEHLLSEALCSAFIIRENDERCIHREDGESYVGMGCRVGLLPS